MGEFTPEWLALREPADCAARSARATQAVANIVDAGVPVQVLDLGCGTGSNLRYLAERLPPDQKWLLVDHDPVLLGTALRRMHSWAVQRGFDTTPGPDSILIQGDRFSCHITTRCMDLGVLDDPAIFSGCALVTASALCDLVSEDWLRALAAMSSASGAAVLLALTYDGRISCVPEEPEDALVRELANDHQRTHQEFGPALGFQAIGGIGRCLEASGYRVLREPSDWTLAPDTYELQRQLVAGWATAAIEMSPSRADLIRRWEARRIAHIDAGCSHIIVGHQDIAAWLER